MADVPKLSPSLLRRAENTELSLGSLEAIAAIRARLGIRAFRPTLRKAADLLASLRTPEGELLPPNTLAEMRRDMARLHFVVEQIKEIEVARRDRLQHAPEGQCSAMVRLLARVIGIGIETADMLVHEVLARNLTARC